MTEREHPPRPDQHGSDPGRAATPGGQPSGFAYGSDGPGYEPDPDPQPGRGAAGRSDWGSQLERVASRAETTPDRPAVTTAVRPRRRAAIPTAWEYGTRGGMPLLRPRRRTLLVLGLVLVLAAGALGYLVLLSPREASGSPLALSFTAGDVYRYRLDMHLEATVSADGATVPFDMSAGMVFSWDVLAVDTDGVAVVSFAIEELSGTLDGQPIPQPSATAVRIRMAPDGRILDGGTSGLAPAAGPGMFVPGADQLTPLLPNHPVKVGDAWTKTFTQDAPFLDTGVTYEARSHLLRYEDVDGVRAAVIQTELTMPLDFTFDLREAAKLAGGSAGLPDGIDPTISFDGEAVMDSTSWLDSDRGELLKGLNQGTYAMSMKLDGFDASGAFPGGEASMEGTLDISLDRLDGRAPPPGPAEQDRDAQAMLQSALAAANAWYTEGDTYRDLAPARLAEYDPTLSFVVSPKATRGTVSVRVEGPRRVVLVTRSDSGNVFCIADDVGAGVSHGTANASKVAGCSQGW
jgi:hypothetical protein